MSRIYEMRITFSSFFRVMTDNYYLKPHLPMREVSLNRILAKNARLIYRLNRFLSNLYPRKYKNQEISFGSERN